MEPFKNLLHAGLLRRMALHLRRADARFDAARFERLAGDGLDALEMKARALHIADALQATLPARFDDAATLIEAALAPPWPDDRLGSDDPCRDGLEGWALWPVGEFVARCGLAQPQRALRTLHAITQRFSAEFAIRPFIAAHPRLCLDKLMVWTQDPSSHVRRLVSEGSRPRLPWGLQLRALVADPSPTLPLLAALQDDASPYVRRSVANHLNDIAKDHPALVCDWVARHLPGAPAQRRALLRHASRTLIKRGDAAMLQLWGQGRPLRGEAALSLGVRRLRLGEALPIAVRLQSTAQRGVQPLVVDYSIQPLQAETRAAAKVFKGWTLELAPGEERQLQRRHPVRAVTTRRHHPGRHRVELRINGRAVAEAHFELQLA